MEVRGELRQELSSSSIEVEARIRNSQTERAAHPPLKYADRHVAKGEFREWSMNVYQKEDG
jgi:hypothetical protein